MAVQDYFEEIDEMEVSYRIWRMAKHLSEVLPDLNPAEADWFAARIVAKGWCPDHALSFDEGRK